MVDEKAMLKTLGQQIRTTRKSNGMTQEYLAELCGFDPTYVSLLERGQRNPPYLTLCKVADRLGVAVGHLVADS